MGKSSQCRFCITELRFLCHSDARVASCQARCRFLCRGCRAGKPELHIYRRAPSGNTYFGACAVPSSTSLDATASHTGARSEHSKTGARYSTQSIVLMTGECIGGLSGHEEPPRSVSRFRRQYARTTQKQQSADTKTAFTTLRNHVVWGSSWTVAHPTSRANNEHKGALCRQERPPRHRVSQLLLTITPLFTGRLASIQNAHASRPSEVEFDRRWTRGSTDQGQRRETVTGQESFVVMEPEDPRAAGRDSSA